MALGALIKKRTSERSAVPYGSYGQRSLTVADPVQRRAAILAYRRQPDYSRLGYVPEKIELAGISKPQELDVLQKEKERILADQRTGQRQHEDYMASQKEKMEESRKRAHQQKGYQVGTSTAVKVSVRLAEAKTAAASYAAYQGLSHTGSGVGGAASGGISSTGGTPAYSTGMKRAAPITGMSETSAGGASAGGGSALGSVAKGAAGGYAGMQAGQWAAEEMKVRGGGAAGLSMLGATAGGWLAAGNPLGAVAGAGVFVASKVFGPADKPQGVTQNQIKTFLNKISDQLKKYSPEEQRKILSSNDPTIREYIKWRGIQLGRLAPPTDPSQAGYQEKKAEYEERAVASQFSPRAKEIDERIGRPYRVQKGDKRYTDKLRLSRKEAVAIIRKEKSKRLGRPYRGYIDPYKALYTIHARQEKAKNRAKWV